MIAHRRYVPEPGDVVWLQFDPQAGHEQTGHRPALVLSASSYNARSGLMMCCPVTSRIRGYPFEVELDGEPRSVVLADQVRGVDRGAQKARYRTKVSPGELDEVKAKARALIA